MYKVYFQDRIVYLCEKAPEHRAGPGQEFYEYRNQTALKKLLDKFSEDEQIQELHLFHSDIGELSNAFKNCFEFLSAGGGVVLNERGEFLAIRRNGSMGSAKRKDGGG